MAAAVPIMMGLSVVGAGLQAAGQLRAADARMRAADVEAAGMREQAALNVQAGYEQGKQIRYEGKRILGDQTAGFASAGVTVGTGSALLLAAEQAKQTELDAVKAEFAGRQSAGVLERQAQLTKFAARVGRREAILQAGGSVLGGGARALLYRGL